MDSLRVNRKEIDERYFIASKEVFGDKELSWEARGVMGYILSKGHGWVVRNKDLEAQGDAGRDLINRIMQELKRRKYIRRYRTHDEQGRFITITEIFPTPLTDAGQNTVSGSAVYGETVDGSTVYGEHGDIESIDDDDPSKINHAKGQTSSSSMAAQEVELELMSIGFSDKDANYMRRLAEKNYGTPQKAYEEIQAWVSCTERCTRITNPAGFVRTKIEKGERCSKDSAGVSEYKIPKKYEHIVKR